MAIKFGDKLSFAEEKVQRYIQPGSHSRKEIKLMEGVNMMSGELLDKSL